MSSVIFVCDNVLQRENSTETVYLSERRESGECPGCSVEEPSMEGDAHHMSSCGEHHVEEAPEHSCCHEHCNPDLIEHEDAELLDIDEDEIDSILSSEDDLDLLDLTDEDDPEEIETSRPIPTHPFEHLTTGDIESDTSDSDGEGGVFPPGGHNDWEVRMLAAEMDRRESLQRRKERLLRSQSLQSRRRVVHTCHGTCGNGNGRKRSTEELPVRSCGRPPLVTAQSLDDHSGYRDLPALYKRSMSYGNIHSAVSSSAAGTSARCPGTMFRDNEPRSSQEFTPNTTRVPAQPATEQVVTSPTEVPLQPPAL